MQTASLLTLVNTYNPYQNYCEEPRCPKTPKFPSFLVSRIVCLGYSILHFYWLKSYWEKPIKTLVRSTLSFLLWTTRPSANKGPGLLCSARRGLGRGHKKTRSLTDGIFLSFLILMKLMFYGISFSKKVFISGNNYDKVQHCIKSSVKTLLMWNYLKWITEKW